MVPAINNILYASDINEGSRPAFRHAVKLAELYNAKLTYLHAVEKISDGAAAILQNVIDREQLKALEKSGSERLIEKIEQRIKSFCEEEVPEGTIHPSDVTTCVDQGKPWQVIIDTADKINADMIVMGVRTHATLQHMLLGSTSRKVIGHSVIPVLIVPLN
jgi:nucleotide-binding universal stress UspA family protein